MITFTRLSTLVFLIAAALPFVAATPDKRDSQCDKDSFWFKERNGCVHHGGPPDHSYPPPEYWCPEDWSWSYDYDCCVPHFPHYPPHPSCPRHWHWSDQSCSCERNHPKPSGKSKSKRVSEISLLPQHCPWGLRACPIAGFSGLTGDYECIDTTNDLESCGGCASLGEGEDCTAIYGGWNVGCVQGNCAIYTCASGFRRSIDGKSCAAI